MGEEIFSDRSRVIFNTDFGNRDRLFRFEERVLKMDGKLVETIVLSLFQCNHKTFCCIFINLVVAPFPR